MSPALLTVAAILLLVADVAIIRSRKPSQEWLKTTAAVQAIALALGILGAAITWNTFYLEVGFFGVTTSGIPFAIGFARRKRQRAV